MSKLFIGWDAEDVTCGDCAFSETGRCRRFPPTYPNQWATVGSDPVFEYPKVAMDNPACAEFKLPGKINL